MKTYVLNLYYPKLESHVRNVKMARDFVEAVAGDEYRMLRAGGNTCSLAFATDKDPAKFQKMLYDMGEEQFQYLLLEISSIPAGWTDKSVYQWLEDRLRMG